MAERRNKARPQKDGGAQNQPQDDARQEGCTKNAGRNA